MIRVLFLALFLTACGGSGGGNDNSGGGNTPTPPPPPPDEGTILDEFCEDTTKVTITADGSGGEVRSEEEKSEECGWEPAPVVVTMERSESDYFKGAIVTVDDPDNVGWDWHVSAGHVIETETGLEIRRDGNLGRATLTINGKEYFFEMVHEPMCDVTRDGSSRYKYDCLGYEQGGASAAMIYYGEEDTQVVQVEIGFVITDWYCENDAPRLGLDPEKVCLQHAQVTPEFEMYQRVYDNVEYFNEFNRKHKVYIEFVVTGIEWGPSWFDIYSFPNGSLKMREESDTIYGVGGSGGYGGQAFQPRSIWPGKTTPASVGLGMGGTMMHEVGHTMGLGHGVWGNPTWTLEEPGDNFHHMGGSIFPRFGHGWDGRPGEGVCGVQGSVMSYGSGAMWTNSLMTCDEIGYSTPGWWGNRVGDRTQSDEAYALNRVRYSFSLIHNEHLSPAMELVADLDPMAEEYDDSSILINDPAGKWIEQREAKISEEIRIMRAAKQ